MALWSQINPPRDAIQRIPPPTTRGPGPSTSEGLEYSRAPLAADPILFVDPRQDCGALEAGKSMPGRHESVCFQVSRTFLKQLFDEHIRVQEDAG
jgi:hypothetical protein